jgi:hypothetical protein
MASVIPIAFQALQAFQTISTVAQFADRGSSIFSDNGEKQSELALAQLQQQQQLQARTAAQNTVNEKQEISIKAETVELERRRALKRAVARQRASFGSGGVSSGDGSSEAVLLGLFEESEEDKATSQRLDNLKLRALDQNLNNINRVNTLRRTQLAEKNRLKNSSSTLNDVSDLLSIF